MRILTIIFAGFLCLSTDSMAARTTAKDIATVPALANLSDELKRMYRKTVSKKKFMECAEKLKNEPKNSEGKIKMHMGRGGEGYASQELYMNVCVGVMAF